MSKRILVETVNYLKGIFFSGWAKGTAIALSNAGYGVIGGTLKTTTFTSGNRLSNALNTVTSVPKALGGHC